MIEFVIYLAGFFDSLSCALGIILVTCALVLIIAFIKKFADWDSCNDNEEDRIRLNEFIKTLLKSFLIVLFISVFIPSQKTIYMILGAHYLKKSDIPTKVELLINKKLDEYLVMEDKKK